MKKIEKTIPYQFYDWVYSDEQPISHYFVHLFNELPSRYINHKNVYNDEIVDYFYKLGFTKLTSNSNESSRLERTSKELVVINESKEIIVSISSSTIDHKDNGRVVTYIFSLGNGEIEEQLNLDELTQFIVPKKRSSINLVKSENGRMDIEEFDLVVEEMDLDLNYGEEFGKVNKTIIDKLNEDNGKGIVLLHGDPGTGKSTYLKYLTKMVTTKDILFIPPSMVEILSEPAIIPFLMEHKNSILIIEDAERVISDRQSFSASSAGVSNILNLTDGILGDCLSIQIVATFNMNKDKIDPALLRKGRLIAEHKFSKLSVEESNNLLKSLEKDYVTSVPMTLSDIYYVNQEEHVVKENNKIGF